MSVAYLCATYGDSSSVCRDELPPINVTTPAHPPRREALAKAERQTDEAARAERKGMLASCDALLTRLEAAFNAASEPAKGG